MILSAEDWLLALRDGAMLASAASALIMGALRFNPRLFLRSYPKEIRAAAAPVTRAERLQRLIVGVPLIALLLGVPIWSAAMLSARHDGAIGADALFADAFTVGMVFNLADWLVLDVLWLGLLRPSWAAIPGTETVSYRFNYGHHFRGFLIGTVLAAIAAAIATAIVR